MTRAQRRFWWWWWWSSQWQWIVFLIDWTQRAMVRDASLCSVSMLPRQQHLTGPCQKQVCNISLSVEGFVALINMHTQGQKLKFSRNQKKMFGFQPLREICGHQQRRPLHTIILRLPLSPYCVFLLAFSKDPRCTYWDAAECAHLHLTRDQE